MARRNNPFLVEGFTVEGFCRNDSFYVRFDDKELAILQEYADSMGYILEPEVMATDPSHPMRFKVWNSATPHLYGWITKVTEKINGTWQPNILYGFYKQGRFLNKYSIVSNIDSLWTRNLYRRRALKFRETTGVKDDRNPFFNTIRTCFGILDLEENIICNFAI